MVVCKFFLSNTCKFGEKCRYEHPRGGAQRNLFGGPSQSWQNSGSPRVTFRDSFGTAGQGSNNQYKWTANQQSSQGSDNSSFQQSTLDFVNNLPKEMETWEKSHMWPFSCVSVDRDLPSLPEFYDICPEELRFEAYEAMKSGNLQPYTQRFQSLQNEFQNKRRQLQHMTLDLKSKLMAVIDEAMKKRQAQSDSTSSLVFGSSQPTQSLFGQSQTAASPGLFGQSTGVTGNSSSGLFGKPTSGSVFGGHFSAGSDNSSTFGSTGSSLFGKSTRTGSVFGNQPQGQAAQTSNLFGHQNQSNTSITSSVFGQTTSQGQQGSSLFGSAAGTTTNQSSNIFGSPAVSPPQGLFGKPAAGLGQATNFSNPFGNSVPTTQTSLFGGSVSQNQSPATLFGKSIPESTSASQNLFGNSVPATQASLFGSPVSQNQSSATLFGKPLPQSTSVPQNLFGNTTPVYGGGDMIGQNLGISAASTTSHGHYTPLTDLTEQEKEAFSAKSFELGRIPIRPPPRELIN